MPDEPTAVPADFQAYWNAAHHSPRNTLKLHKITSWKALQEFLSVDDATLIARKLQYVGPKTLYRWREALAAQGLGPAPPDLATYITELNAGPVLPGFGPVKKLGLSQDVVDLLDSLDANSWDDVVGRTNSELISHSDVSTAWRLRYAQHLAGRGEYPGPKPSYGSGTYTEGAMRFRQGLRTDAASRLSYEVADAVEQLEVELKAKLDIVHAAIDDAAAVANRFAPLIRGHVTSEEELKVLLALIPSLRDLTLLPVRNGVWIEFTGHYDPTGL